LDSYVLFSCAIAGLRIQAHSIERRKVLKGAEHGAVKDRPKVDLLMRAVAKRHRKPVRPSNFEPGDR
jgi:hypothetical protein